MSTREYIGKESGERDFAKEKKKREKEREREPSFGSRFAFVASATNLGLGNSQIAKRTGIRIHVDDSNVNTYRRNDVATHTVGTHLRRLAAACAICMPARVHTVRTYEDADTFFTKRFSFRGALPEKRERDDARR